MEGYNLIDKNGNPNLRRYKACFADSLDLMKLREIYYKVYRNNRFGYVENHKEYCNRIINVTFKYSIRKYNRIGKNRYIKAGIDVKDSDFKDGVAIKDGELVGIITKMPPSKKRRQFEETPILHPVDKELLGNYFEYRDGYYHAKNNIPTLHSVASVRDVIYKNGFVCNGIKYVRWKRSAGSARVGKCLFIDENLYDKFHKWEMCGLDIERGDKVDLAALESYISLTSSSIVGILQIRPENILLIDDYESEFYEDAINVTEQDGKLVAKPERTKVVNNIFDGESLIDFTAMGRYRCKGMILLRNRFFKSCCFNTNLQQWFQDHNITSISQLNGKTRATDISQIKLITTPSSIKYLKFSTFDKWLDNLDPIFGVVKYEKPTHFMDGRLVQTHYQLINSIQLSLAEMEELLKPTFDFMTLVKNQPSVLKYWIKFSIEDEITITPLKFKTDIVYKMMSVNDTFTKTKLYYDFQMDFLKSFTKELKCGHVLINGNYSTLCGNPIEMLQQSIGIFDGQSVMKPHSVHSTRFDFGKYILGSRSPHISMSNVLLVQNEQNELITKYMNPTNEIVYVNSIDENILQQLAGCD